MSAVDGERVMMDQKKPVATPGDVSDDWSETRYVDLDCFRRAVAANILDGNGAVFVQSGSHHAGARLAGWIFYRAAEPH